MIFDNWDTMSKAEMLSRETDGVLILHGDRDLIIP